MVFYATILEQRTNDKDPERSKTWKIDKEFEDLSLAKKYIIDFLVHVMEEGLRQNFYNLDFSKSEFCALFEMDKFGFWRVLNRHKNDIDGIGMLYNALYLPGYHTRMVSYTISSDDVEDANDELPV